MKEFFDIFYEEAKEHLSAIEDALLELEDHPSNEAGINTIFRAIHTIKGSAGMVGFDHVSEFTHHIETYLDKVRNKELSLNPKVIGLLLEVKDHIYSMIVDEHNSEMDAVSQAYLKRLEPFYGEAFQPMQAVPVDEAAGLFDTPKSPPADGLWRISIKPNVNTFKDGFDPLPLLRELTALGDSFVTTKMKKPDAIYHADDCYLSFDVLLPGSIEEADIDDVFMFVADDWTIEKSKEDYMDADKIGELLVDDGVLSRTQLENFVEKHTRIGAELSESGLAKEEDVDNALAKQAFIRKNTKKEKAAEMIKVPSDKLDRLMNLVGELVIVQSSLDRAAYTDRKEDLLGISEEFHRLTTELRDTTFDIRMLPIGSTYSRFRRLVRDLSRELEKDIHFETKGEETELDKMVLDKLGDPLVHLLRNSLDHGIESPDERAKAGKSQRGTITINALHDRGQVLIQITDDGRGMDREKIGKKAIEKGLIETTHGMADEDVYNLIFEPGFSTAEKVSDVSGRGVGMDVVKTSIENLQGSVKIDSELGKGSTVSIYLPMTLAIIEGLLVRVGGDHFVIPLATVEECVETSSNEKSLDNGSRLIYSRGRYIPTVRIKDVFEVEPAQSNGDKKEEFEQTIIVRLDDKQFGITIDEVIGQHQTVIKSLGRLYKDVEGIMGATILGSGNVAMILDIGQLITIVDQTDDVFSHAGSVSHAK